MMINVENFLLPKFCAGENYPYFSKHQTNAKICTNHAHHKPNTPVKIRETMEIWPEEEKLMAEMYANAI